MSEAIGNGNGDLLLRLMRATDLRSKVIANNIANMDTPGYRRQVVRFEDLLQQAATRGGAAMARVEPEIVDDLLTPGRPDGNNVTLELEMNSSRQNGLMSDLYTSLLQSRFSLIRASIDGGR